MNLLQKWIGVSVFAVAMGYLEAAVVFYLRTMVGRMDPYQPDPLPRFAGLGMAELWREAATLVMIMAVGTIAGKTWRGKVGYAFFVFGIWDITYYIFCVRSPAGQPRWRIGIFYFSCHFPGGDRSGLLSRLLY